MNKRQKNELLILAIGIILGMALMPTAFATCNEDNSVCASTPIKATYDLSKGGMFTSYELNSIWIPKREPIEVEMTGNWFDYLIQYPVTFIEWRNK